MAGNQCCIHYCRCYQRRTGGFSSSSARQSRRNEPLSNIPPHRNRMPFLRHVAWICRHHSLRRSKCIGLQSRLTAYLRSLRLPPVGIDQGPSQRRQTTSTNQQNTLSCLDHSYTSHLFLHVLFASTQTMDFITAKQGV